MKKYIFIAIASILAFSGCSSSSSEAASSTAAVSSSVEESEPLDLTGTWKQVNSNSEDTWQEATISGDIIEINWVSDNGDTKALYWAGSYIAPTEDTDTYTWDSVNDHEKTDSALLASGDDTKTFTYENGQLTYEASAMGVTTTVRLEKE